MNDPQLGDDWFASVPALAMTHCDCDRVGIALQAPRGEVTTLVASDAVVRVADWLQSQHADGPVVTPIWSTPQLVVDDVVGCGPWPVWTKAIADLGVRSVLATQIVTPDGSAGALTLYYARPVAIAVHHLALAKALARHVASELAHARTTGQLAEAIESRTLIGQAQGMLMERFRLSTDDAFAVLKRHSQDTNSKLHDVAERLVRTRDLNAYAYVAGPGR